MKIRKIFLFLLLVLSCTGMIWAGGSQEADAGQSSEVSGMAGPLTVVDALGRTVTLEKPAERIAFTHMSTAEALKVLDAWDMVVGRDGYTHDNLVFPGLNDIPALGNPMDGPYAPNMEILLEIEPDLLILEIIPMPGMNELIEKLEGVVPVIAVKTYEPGDIIEQSLRNLGRLLDRKKEAEAFLEWSHEISDMLLAETGGLSDAEKTTLLFKTGWGDPNDLMTFTDELPAMVPRNKAAGCINVAADLPSQGGWVPKLDPEWVATTEFEILVMNDAPPGSNGSEVADYALLADHRQKVMELPVFAESKAVKDGRVYMFAPVFTESARYIVGFAYLAKWCHPELFTDMDPKALHQEYIDKFLRVDWDLNEQGVFVYPEI